MTLLICLLVLGLVFGLIVPLAVLLPLALLALAVVAVGVTVAGVLALLCSPLLAVAGLVWLLVRCVRGPRRRPAPAGGATIGA